MLQPAPRHAALPLALTLGEPAGIGPDIALRAFAARKEKSVPGFYIVADPQFIAERAKLLGLDIAITVVEPEDALATFDRSLPVAALDMRITAKPGQPDGSSALAAISAIKRAVSDVFEGRAGAVVTNPISKDILYKSGFADPGHTEYLARLAHEHTGKSVMPVMMLWCDELMAIPVTIHIPLADVPGQLTTALIVETARVAVRDLVRRFSIARPRLVIAGLNPHAGENGSLGKQEETIIRPAIETLRAEGIEVTGPQSADTMFHPQARKAYDVALCMYHDQALIPVKTLAFDRAVNVTLGLPFIRTSPDHGTAFDIAGTGRADPGSLIAALQLAARLAAQSESAARSAMK
ncbi:MAG: 4-hydroxythreonine-4-phosphate dehydrogenase PdxA [Pseudorhodoplanes sp.]